MNVTTICQHVLTTLAHSERLKYDDSKTQLERRYHQGKADALRIVAAMMSGIPEVAGDIRQAWISPPRVGNVVGEFACPQCHVGMEFRFQDRDTQRYECPEHGVWDYDWQGKWSEV